MKAIASCKHIYDVAITKGQSQLEEMEHETRLIFTEEFDEEKDDLQHDEVKLFERI